MDPPTAGALGGTDHLQEEWPKNAPPSWWRIIHEASKEIEDQFKREKAHIMAEGKSTGAPFSEQRSRVTAAYKLAIKNHNNGLRALIADFKQRANAVNQQALPVAIAIQPGDNHEQVPVVQAVAAPQVINIDDDVHVKEADKQSYFSVRIHYTKKTKEKPKVIWTTLPPHASAVQRAAVDQVFKVQNDINKREWGIEHNIPGPWQPVLQHEKDQASDRLAAGRLVGTLPHRALHVIRGDLELLNPNSHICPATCAKELVDRVSAWGVSSNLNGALYALDGLRSHWIEVRGPPLPLDDNFPAEVIASFLQRANEDSFEKAERGQKRQRQMEQLKDISNGDLQKRRVNTGESGARTHLEGLRLLDNRSGLIDAMKGPVMSRFSASRNHSQDKTSATPTVSIMIAMEIMATGKGPATGKPFIRIAAENITAGILSSIRAGHLQDALFCHNGEGTGFIGVNTKAKQNKSDKIRLGLPKYPNAAIIPLNGFVTGTAWSEGLVQRFDQLVKFKCLWRDFDAKLPDDATIFLDKVMDNGKILDIMRHLFRLAGASHDFSLALSRTFPRHALMTTAKLKLAQDWFLEKLGPHGNSVLNARDIPCDENREAILADKRLMYMPDLYARGAKVKLQFTNRNVEIEQIRSYIRKVGIKNVPKSGDVWGHYMQHAPNHPAAPVNSIKAPDMSAPVDPEGLASFNFGGDDGPQAE